MENRDEKGRFINGHFLGKRFYKGMIPWSKGKKFPQFSGENNPAKRPEVREKISLAMKGKKHNYAVWNKGKKGIMPTPWNKGKSFIQMIGNQHGFKKGQHPWNRGKECSEDAKKKMSLIKIGKYIGEKSSQWKGGITPINTKIRTSLGYKQWRKAVFERDDYRCFDCGERGVELHADHIYQFAKYPRLRFMLENGQTLCVNCHKAKTIFERTSKYVAVASSTGVMER